MMSRTLPGSEPLGLREAGSGAPLVLIHGVGMQSAAWEPQISALCETHHVVALDMPGHGQSAPLAPGAPLEAFVDWARGAIEALGLGPASVAGHSMGALVAGGLAVSHPDLVSRVALLNGVFRRDAAARAAVEARADEIGTGSFDLETPLKRWFGDTPTEVAACKKVSGWLRQVDIGGYATAYGAFARGDATYADRFHEIRCPLLALTGSGDANSSPEMSRAMAEAAPNGRAVVIEGHRHMVNLTAPERVTEEMRAWLAEGTPEETA